VKICNTKFHRNLFSSFEDETCEYMDRNNPSPCINFTISMAEKVYIFQTILVAIMGLHVPMCLISFLSNNVTRIRVVHYEVPNLTGLILSLLSEALTLEPKVESCKYELAPLDMILSQFRSFPMLATHFLRHLIVILPSLSRSSKRPFSKRDFLTEIVYFPKDQPVVTTYISLS
jgi:hypothetical protein